MKRKSLKIVVKVQMNKRKKIVIKDDEIKSKITDGDIEPSLNGAASLLY